jgi:16S rRNA (guanine1207-N2)-methyltransferase
MALSDLTGRLIYLERRPGNADANLQAWDAADTYILDQLRESGVGTGAVLLVNDAFGALGLGLGPLDQPVCSWNDSFLAREALRANLIDNGRPADAVAFFPADETPGGPCHLVLLKFPKSMVYLHDLLTRLRPALAPGCRLIAGGIIKHTPAKAYRLLEDIIGPTRTSLGWKKARLAFTEFDPDLPDPPQVPAAVHPVPDLGFDVHNGPHVFSRDRLDAGTRLMLAQIPARQDAFEAADLGCGGGVLSLALAARCPRARILGVDESFQAVASARANAKRLGFGPDRINFQTGDGLTSLPPDSLDLVVCNPPFHQAQVVGDTQAWAMFHQARKALRPGGELLVVGNRHLGYHLKLQRLFGNCHPLVGDPRFTVLSATKSGGRR